jgi:hypothetical protein
MGESNLYSPGRPPGKLAVMKDGKGSQLSKSLPRSKLLGGSKGSRGSSSLVLGRRLFAGDSTNVQSLP